MVQDFFVLVDLVIASSCYVVVKWVVAVDSWLPLYLVLWLCSSGSWFLKSSSRTSFLHETSRSLIVRNEFLRLKLSWRSLYLLFLCPFVSLFFFFWVIPIAFWTPLALVRVLLTLFPSALTFLSSCLFLLFTLFPLLPFLLFNRLLVSLCLFKPSAILQWSREYTLLLLIPFISTRPIVLLNVVFSPSLRNQPRFFLQRLILLRSWLLIFFLDQFRLMEQTRLLTFYDRDRIRPIWILAWNDDCNRVSLLSLHLALSLWLCWSLSCRLLHSLALLLPIRNLLLSLKQTYLLRCLLRSLLSFLIHANFI